MTPPLTLTLDRRHDGAPTLMAKGEIDLSNVRMFADALGDAISTSGGTAVTVDLSAVDYVDSAAINALFARATDIRLVVKPLLMPVLTISGLTELTPVEAARPATG